MDDFKIGEDIEETPGESKIRKSNSIIPIIIVIVVAIIIGLTVFLVSNAILNPSKKETEQATTTKLDLKDENVEILYNYVTYGTNNTRYEKFIKEQNVTIDSFSNYDKFYYALMFVETSDIVDNNKTDEAGNKIFSIPESKIKTYMKRFFGPNINYSTDTEITYAFSFSSGGKNIATLTYNPTTQCFDIIFKDTSKNKETTLVEPYYAKLTDAYQSSDGTLTLKEKIIYTDAKVNTDGTYNITIYKDYNHTEQIDIKQNYSQELLKSNPITIEDYSNKASTITYTFKTYNNTYYFESSTIS